MKVLFSKRGALIRRKGRVAILIMALLLTAGVKCFALTAANIITEARIYLKDQSLISTRQQFSDATLLSFINDGQREANAIGWLLQSSTTFALTSGTTEYALPSDFMATQFVLVNNIKIDQTSLNELNANVSGWRTAKGTPNKYYVYLGNPPVIGFYPAPNASATATMYYVQQPTELTLTSQTPFNGWSVLAPYHSGLIYYVVYRAYLTLEEDDLAGIYLQEWGGFLQMLKTGVLKQPDFNPGLVGRRN